MLKFGKRCLARKFCIKLNFRLVATTGKNAYNDFNNVKDSIKGSSGSSSTGKITAKEATSKAKDLGYEKTSETSHGQPIYKKSKGKPQYITPDVDSHNGGAWKGADTIKDLASKKTRAGTYDVNLNRIGD